MKKNTIKPILFDFIQTTWVVLLFYTMLWLYSWKYCDTVVIVSKSNDILNCMTFEIAGTAQDPYELPTS